MGIGTGIAVAAAILGVAQVLKALVNQWYNWRTYKHHMMIHQQGRDVAKAPEK